MIYITVNQDGFIEGWSSVPSTNSIEITKQEDIDKIMSGYSRYRYDKDKKELIHDDSFAITMAKEERLHYFNALLKEKNNYGFIVNIKGEQYRFQNNDSNRSFLQKAYSMSQDKLISEATIKVVNENNNEVTKKIDATSIYEIWILSFLHEEELNSHLDDKVIPELTEAKTLDEIASVEW